jgi:DNA invertase Pin-like site-specific DNA recombinase
VGDTLLVWKLDRLGRNLRHLVNTVHELATRGVGFKVLTGHGASIDTTTAAGKMVFGIFAALSEFERELISERTKAGLASARARGRKGGAPFKMTPAKVRLALVTMGQPKTKLVATNVSGKVVQGSGHWLMEEAPDKVIPALMTFLNGNP